jgi:Ser/Thr protein kinase RdoA (MazF antagonist)
MMRLMNGNSQHPYDELTPELVLAAVEQFGHPTTGGLMALNSYENRVYQVQLADQTTPLIVKFYRPGRWSAEQIREEHRFSRQAAEADIPVVLPLADETGETLHQISGFCYALFPRKGGHAPELDHMDNLAIMGRTLARLHRVGAQQPYQHRPALNALTFGQQSIEVVSEQFIPLEFRQPYLAVCQPIMTLIEAQLSGSQAIRVHGDLHVGNILLREDIPHLVDFDDSRMAPAIQDIWMLLSGNQQDQQRQLEQIITAYEAFRGFPYSEIRLMNALRTLRMIHHTAWLARRWDDPAFPPAFPWFASHQYWEQHISDLREQLYQLETETSLLN